MKVFNFLEDNSSINITLNASQLLEIVDYAISKTKAEFQASQEPETYVTRKRTAEMLDVDLSTLWRYDKIGYLQPVQIGGKRRYKQSDIDKILAGGGVR